MSQIATTIEQSKRLLALGVPPETADMHYYQIANLKDWVLTVGGKLGTSNDVPAWSLSALIGIKTGVEIIEKWKGCYVAKIRFCRSSEHHDTPIAAIIDCIEHPIPIM
jgi:hypothetical protein